MKGGSRREKGVCMQEEKAKEMRKMKHLTHEKLYEGEGKKIVKLKKRWTG